MLIDIVFNESESIGFILDINNFTYTGNLLDIVVDNNAFLCVELTLESVTDFAFI